MLMNYVVIIFNSTFTKIAFYRHHNIDCLLPWHWKDFVTEFFAFINFQRRLLSFCLFGVFLSEPSQDVRGNLGVPMDISSPITSDEEYLSPLEEAMDFLGSSYHGPESRKIIDTRFKEPPAFQVNEC